MRNFIISKLEFELMATCKELKPLVGFIIEGLAPAFMRAFVNGKSFFEMEMLKGDSPAEFLIFNSRD